MKNILITFAFALLIIWFSRPSETDAQSANVSVTVSANVPSSGGGGGGGGASRETNRIDAVFEDISHIDTFVC
jgi:hypothetical protein